MEAAHKQHTEIVCFVPLAGWLVREKPAVLINNGPRHGKMENWVQKGDQELGEDASETSWALRAVATRCF